MARLPPTYSPASGVPRHSNRNDDPRKRQAKRGQRTNDKRWRARRAAQLRRQWWCTDCLAETNLKLPANQVDHKNGDSSDNRPENLDSLCHSHHSRKTAKYDGGFGNVRKANKS